jgi:NTP pyrophosphatase (non-canonical NTP hydrolase)
VSVTIQELANRLHAWHHTKYGNRAPNIPRTVRKLGEELGEFHEALIRAAAPQLDPPAPPAEGMPHESTPDEEAADVVFLLFHLCRAAGYPLGPTLVRKLKAIEDRIA